MKPRVKEFKELLSKLKPSNPGLIESVEQAFKICLENEFDEHGELAPGILTNYELLSHGVEGEQYFQGAGTSFTKFKHIATGVGSSEKEAFDDALEQIAQTHDVDFSKIEKDGENLSTKVAPEITAEDSDMHYYFSVRYNLPRPVYKTHVDSPSLEDEGKRLGSYTEAENENKPLKKEKCKKCGKMFTPSGYNRCPDCVSESHSEAERATRVESKSLVESSFSVKFSTDNESFSGENRNNEIIRILRDIADKFESGRITDKIFDANGNHIGTVGLSRASIRG
jgi:hypothetical protein